MRNLIFITLIIICGCSTRQAKEEKTFDTLAADTVNEQEIVFGGPCKYTRGQVPKSKFPLDVTDKIVLVSYQSRVVTMEKGNDLIAGGTFKVDNIKQRVTLNKNQADSLLSILYNFNSFPAGVDTSMVQADCYNPRHSIVFYKRNEAIAFLEICFECGGTVQTKGVDFGEFCPEKRCMLQNFFKANKAGFGIIDEMCE